MEHGFDYLGNDISGKIYIPMSDPDHCARMCAEEPACKVWTANLVMQKCFLKTSAGGKTPKVSDISGTKECGGKPPLTPPHTNTAPQRRQEVLQPPVPVISHQPRACAYPTLLSHNIPLLQVNSAILLLLFLINVFV